MMRIGAPCESFAEGRQGRGLSRALPIRAFGWLLLLVAAGLLSAPTALPAQEETSDDLIYDRVIRELVNDPELKGNHLDVEVRDRVVTVSGYVKTEKLQQRVDKVVKRAKGVKKVINKVEVRR